MKIQRVTNTRILMVYRGFHWVRGGYKGLQAKGLQGVTRALVKPYGEKIVHSGVKAPHLA